MKISIRKALVLLAIVLSFVSIQSVWAGSCNVSVIGTITAVDKATSTITIDGDTVVYGIPFTFLLNQEGVELVVGNEVVITAFSCPLDGHLTACTLSVNGDDAITLPGKRLR